MHTLFSGFPKELGQVRGTVPSAVVYILASLLLFFVPVAAPTSGPDELDPSFGSGGKVVTDLFGGVDSVLALALQPDGKIVAAGDSFDVAVAARVFGIVRYNSDGSIDPSFGVGGKVSTNFFGQRLNSTVSSIAVQGDGKIVAVGTAVTLTADFKLIGHAVVARYNADGSLDGGFGVGGKLTVDVAGPASPFFSSVLIQQDGKILLGGSVSLDPAAPSASSVFALERLASDGSRDTSFGSGGIVTTAFPNGRSTISKLAIQPDGLIIAGGGAARDATGNSTSFSLVRYRGDGSLDTSFGSGGLVTTDFPGNDFAGIRDVAVVDGRIVAAGAAFSSNPSRRAFAGARYNSDGSLDPSFGSGGKATVDYFGGIGVPRSAAIRSDGKIIVGGWVDEPKSQSKDGRGNDFALEQFNADGSVDASFGSGGTVITEFSDEENDEAYVLMIQPDRKIIAAGSTSGGDDFALARYETEPDFAMGFRQSIVTANRGTTARATLQLDRFGGFSGIVTVTHSDVSGLSVRIKPDSVPTADSSVSIKFKVKPNAAAGAHQITFTGEDASGKQRFATVTLVIE